MAKKRAAPAQSKLDALGIEAVCAQIADLKSLTAIAADSGVSIGTLLAWIDAEPERSARAREARAKTARMWDEKATREIEDAKDGFGLAKAKELAHHYRWRASKIAPREYGEKIETTVAGSLRLTCAAELSDDELATLARPKQEQTA